VGHFPVPLAPTFLRKNKATDPTSLELFELIVERVPSLPLLAIVTFRPEFVLNGRRGSADAATTSSSTSPDRFKKPKEAIANEGEREMRRTPAGSSSSTS
jgi:hypothetical protein